MLVIHPQQLALYGRAAGACLAAWAPAAGATPLRPYVLHPALFACPPECRAIVGRTLSEPFRAACAAKGVPLCWGKLCAQSCRRSQRSA